MRVKMWGTRGSLPTPTKLNDVATLVQKWGDLASGEGVKTLDAFKSWVNEKLEKDPDELGKGHYGGNTMCTEVSSDDGQKVFVDAGSGLVYAGDDELKKGVREYHIFQTHFHWDHIMGFPFFIPAYIPGMQIHFYYVHAKGEQDLKIQFNGSNFPVEWDKLGATIQFHRLKLYEPVKIDTLQVTPFVLDHPGGSFGYRVDADGASVVVGIDGEYKRIGRDELGKDLKYYQDLDAFIFDGQYELDELASRYDWGHCTPTVGAELALREGIHNLILAHHDPRAGIEKIERMQTGARNYIESTKKRYGEVWSGGSKPTVHSAYDGMTFQVRKGQPIEVIKSF